MKIVILIFISLLFNSCSNFKKNPPVIRLMDQLTSDSIVEHPFRSLKDLIPKSNDKSHYHHFLKKFQLSNIDIDYQGDDNPLHIKRIMRIKNFSFPVMASPAYSHFCFSRKITHDCMLDFGIGFRKFRRSRKKKKVVIFKIILETENPKIKITLFNRRLNTETSFVIEREQIDLSAWINQTVKLHFITELAVPSDGSIPKSLAIPIWENPMITEPSQQPKNNIILISIDTVRPDHLSCYGYARNTTPQIDKIARDGVTFMNTYSTTSWTLPAHTSLFSGLSCNNHKIYLPKQKISPKTRLLTEILKKQYYTMAFTGGGYLSPQYGFRRGFDQYYSFKIKTSMIRRREVDLITTKVCKWLNSNHNKSFFLFLHTYQPHDPYANLSPLGKSYLTRTSKWDMVKLSSLWKGKDRFSADFSEDEKQNIVDLYDGELKYTDSVFIGKIIESLKKNSLYDNSLIIITSDHGEEFYDHQAWLHDHSIYDESIRIPLIIKFPFNKHGSKKIYNVVRITDIMPTILGEASIKMSHLNLDGETLMPQILGQENKNRIFITDLALRIGDFALPDIIAINSDQFKLILNKKIRSPYIKKTSLTFRKQQIELYDLKNDPKETKNLALDSRYTNLCNLMLREIKLYEKKLMQDSVIKSEVLMDDQIRDQLRSLGYIN